MASIKSSTAESPTRQTLIDQPDANTIYLGLSKPGALTSAPVWQIRLVLTNGSLTTIQYANGSDSYNQVWDNRTSLSYS